MLLQIQLMFSALFVLGASRPLAVLLPCVAVYCACVVALGCSSGRFSLWGLVPVAADLLMLAAGVIFAASARSATERLKELPNATEAAELAASGAAGAQAAGTLSSSDAADTGDAADPKEPAADDAEEKDVVAPVSEFGMWREADLKRVAAVGLREHWLFDSASVSMDPDRILGRGGFGVVVVGRLNGTPIAMKVSHPKANGKAGGMGQLANELRVLRRLRHPSIVGFHGACIDVENGSMTLLMELIWGHELGRFMSVQRERVDESCQTRMVMDLLSAVRYLHGRRPAIVHGDLKPESIMVEQRALGPRVWPHIRLIDFGSSRVMDGSEKPMGGTLAWKAPEVIIVKKCPASTATDIYSLGRVVVFIIAGQIPFEGRDKSDVKRAVRSRQLVEPTWPDERGGLSGCQECRNVIEACLEFQPADRPDVGHVHDTLQQKLGDPIGPSLQSAKFVNWADALTVLHPYRDIPKAVYARFDVLDPSATVTEASPGWVELFVEATTVPDVLWGHSRDVFHDFLRARLQEQQEEPDDNESCTENFGDEFGEMHVVSSRQFEFDAERVDRAYSAKAEMTFPSRNLEDPTYFVRVSLEELQLRGRVAKSSRESL